MVMPDFEAIYLTAHCGKEELENDLRSKYEMQYLGENDDFEQTMIQDCELLEQLGTDHVEFGELMTFLSKYIGINTPGDASFREIKINGLKLYSSYRLSNRRFKDPFFRRISEKQIYEEKQLRGWSSTYFLIPKKSGIDLKQATVLYRFQPYFVQQYGFFGGVNTHIRVEPVEYLTYFNVKSDQIKDTLEKYKTWVTNFQTRFKESLSKSSKE